MKKYLKFACLGVVAIALAVIALCKNDSDTSKASTIAKNDSMSIDISTASSWSNGADYGKVMNVDIINVSNQAVKNWKVDLTFPTEVVLEGNWGAEIKSSGKVIQVAPLEYNKEIGSKSGISCGFLLKASKDFNDVEVSAKVSADGISTSTNTVKPTVMPTVKPTQTPTVAPTVKPRKTAQQIVDEMKIGWNLGNTMDSLSHEWMTGHSPTDYETAWGNVVTTQRLIDSVKQRGFNTVRIPVSWGEKMDSNNKIDEAWLNRVKEIVDYCYKNDMYCIVNTHHETDWLYPTEARKESGATRLKAIWEQVSEKFKDYDEHLIFETMNETRLVGTSDEWTAGTSESWRVINYFNEVAVKAIRNSGGNNKTRAIMVPCYGANASGQAVNAMTFPENDDMLIISVHAYSPYYFAMVAKETSYWGSEQDKRELTSQFDSIKSAAKGRPVVIGEMGTINKDNNTDSRTRHAAFYSKEAKQRGFTIIWWDNGQIGMNEDEKYGIVDRTTLQWYYPEVIDALINNAR